MYAEKLIALGDDAFLGQPADVKDRQLVGYFIDGLYHDYMKMKVMRENPVTLQLAVDIATREQNLRKRFNFRNGVTKVPVSQVSGEESMEVDHFRKRPRCYNCGKRGHLAKVCSSRKQVHAVQERDFVAKTSQKQSRNVQCWSCGSLGHISRNCPNKRLN